jgi:hypothetical protein
MPLPFLYVVQGNRDNNAAGTSAGQHMGAMEKYSGVKV